MMVRVNGDLRLTAGTARQRGTFAGSIRVPGHTGELVRASDLLLGVREMRRPVTASIDDQLSGGYTNLVATTRVRMPGVPTGELTLLGVSPAGAAWPAEVWLTDLTEAQPAALLRLSQLIQRVEMDFDDISESVGIRDFAGRSFTGWHRHVTLASAAHTVVVLAGRGSQLTRRAC